MSEQLSLDDPSSYKSIDKDDMYSRLEQFADQMQESWNLAGRVHLPDDYRAVRNVVLAGMGGSAISGSLLESYAGTSLSLPFTVWRNYGVPGFVGPDTLFIAMSFSGNTEETVSGLRLARERGAKIVAVTTGGTVGQLAREWNFPLVEFQYAAQPRAALGYLFLPVLRIMSRLGFVDVSEDDLSESVEIVQRVTRQWSADRPTGENLAKQLAQDFHGKVAVIYAAEHLAAVSRRWKTQMNENAKNWAFFEEFPELNHNTIVGYEHPSRFNDLVQLVVLTGSGYSRRIQVRVDVTQQLLDRYHVPYRRVDAPGTSSLAQMFSAIMLGDFVTYYLALLNGSDPTVIEPIDILKHALAQTTG